MNPIAAELTDAYRREEQLYLRILDLVEQQNRIMEEDPNPSVVLNLCGDVEGLLDQIADIEEAIAPAKKEWEQSKRQPPQGLDVVLGSIQGSIEKIALRQDHVRQGLMQYIQHHQDRVGRARASVNARRARVAYKPA